MSNVRFVRVTHDTLASGSSRFLNEENISRVFCTCPPSIPSSAHILDHTGSRIRSLSIFSSSTSLDPRCSSMYSRVHTCRTTNCKDSLPRRNSYKRHRSSSNEEQRQFACLPIVDRRIALLALAHGQSIDQFAEARLRLTIAARRYRTREPPSESISTSGNNVRQRHLCSSSPSGHCEMPSHSSFNGIHNGE